MAAACMDLNAEQTAAVAAVKRGENVVICGAAGTGKSACVDAIVTALGGKITLTAMTGVAANNINGVTLHSALKIGICDMAPRVKAKINARLADGIRNVGRILVDEASMLSDKTFSWIDEYLQALMKTDKLWGGLQVILIGDMRQLAPVAKKGSKEGFFFKSPEFDGMFTICRLIKNYRQTCDPVFQGLLDRVAIGQISKADIALLESRVSKAPVTDDTTYIFSRREDVARRNAEMMAKLDGKQIDFVRVCRETPGRLATAENMQKLIARALDGTLSRFEPKLTLKVGAYVMATVNLRGLFYNGMTGRVLDINDDTVKVKFDTGSVVFVERAEFTFDQDNIGSVTISQFPLILAYAFTAHRVQGLTLPRIVAQLGSDVFAPGQAYVILSRCRELSKLTLTSFVPDCVFAVPDAVKFYNDIPQ